MDKDLIDFIERTARQGFAEQGRGWVIVAVGEPVQVFYVNAAAWPAFLRDVLGSLDPVDERVDLRLLLESYEPASEYLVLTVEAQADGQSQATPVQLKYRWAAPPMA
jgi:hypothetical protein